MFYSPKTSMFVHKERGAEVFYDQERSQRKQKFDETSNYTVSMAGLNAKHAPSRRFTDWDRNRISLIFYEFWREYACTA